MDAPTPSRRDFLSGKVVQDAIAEARSRQAIEIASATPPPPLLEIGRKAMACEFHVYLNIADRSLVEPAVAALELLEPLEAQLTVFRDDSELSRINRLAFERAMTVERRLFDLLTLALDLHRQTEGAFDITAGPISKLWGFYRRAGRVPAEDEIAAVLERVGSQHVTLDPASRTVRFARQGMEFNLGGIGKGYSLDRCVEQLQACGVNEFLMHGGQSSIIGCGSRAGVDGWSVALRHPLRDEIRLGEIWLRGTALGTSGSAHQFFYHEGRRYSHILDPRTARPAEGLLSTTVIAPSGALADALATAFFVLGVERSLAYCEAHPEIAAILIAPGSKSGALEIHTSENLDGIWQPY
jgi:FAD:protein FMN transferase